MIEFAGKIMSILQLKSYEELLFVLILILNSVVIFPTLLLFSRYIYQKYGILNTRFNTRRFDFKTEFKLFMKQNKINFVFGIAIYFCQGCILVWFCFFIINQAINVVSG
ncbi:MAG: hypothetical protein GY737_09190 [Desulfobacteraceae bacterium]|nr:hypothetical protein [Desulfobacteraceae bacterium]